MNIAQLKNQKERKVLLTGYYGADEFITIRYINREIWNYINKMTVKTEDGLIYSKMQELSDKIPQSEKYTIAMQKVSASDLEKGRECSLIVNKLLIEHGIDSKNHSFVDGDKPVKLDYEILNMIGGKVNPETSLDFYNFVLNEIRNFNNGFELGE